MAEADEYYEPSPTADLLDPRTLWEKLPPTVRRRAEAYRLGTRRSLNSTPDSVGRPGVVQNAQTVALRSRCAPLT